MKKKDKEVSSHEILEEVSGYEILKAVEELYDIHYNIIRLSIQDKITLKEYWIDEYVNYPLGKDYCVYKMITLLYEKLVKEGRIIVKKELP